MFPASFARSRISPLAQKLAVASKNLNNGFHLRPSAPPSFNNTHGMYASRSFSNASKEGANATTKSATAEKSFLQKFLGPKEMPPRGTMAWYGEMVLVCTVFAITGTSTMLFVRPVVKTVLSLEGSFKDGPWAYRISTLVIMSPLYSILLVAVGTVFGRHAYFRFFSVKMLSRFGIPPEMLDKTFHETKKTFRKW